ncbi:MAG TPA: hypothetical protein VGS21_04210, partial [Acidimicrobiales bacterium]|nr:hypothetical protein [Acidimicrobiales bacterium]
MSERNGLVPAQELVERGLRAAALGSPQGKHAGAVVIVDDGSSAEMRFAVNTTTTNGLRRSRSVTVAVMEGRDDGVAVGVASSSGTGEIEDLVAAALADAATAEAAEDASDLLDPYGDDDDFTAGPPETGLSSLGHIVGGLGDAFSRARAEGRVLAGFAEHHLATTYLGTSTGMRRRFVQPTGKLEVVARSVDGTRSAWVGAGSPTLADVDLAEIDERLRTRLSWAERRVDLPAGRYEALLPPDAVADLMADMAWAMGGRDAEDG